MQEIIKRLYINPTITHWIRNHLRKTSEHIVKTLFKRHMTFKIVKIQIGQNGFKFKYRQIPAFLTNIYVPPLGGCIKFMISTIFRTISQKQGRRRCSRRE